MFKKIVYCSPIEGLVHWQGKPLAGLQITRFLRSGGFGNGENVDHAQTNGQGQFRLETLSERRFLRPDLLSANPHVNQVLTVNFDRKTYLIWTFMKLDFQLGTESKEGHLRLECDLSKFEEGTSFRIVHCENNGVIRNYE